MGIFSHIKKTVKEEAGYRKILAEKVKVASRQSYAESKIKYAREQARARARQPPLIARFGTGFMATQVAKTPKAISVKPIYKTTYKKKGKKYIKVRRKVGTRMPAVKAAAPYDPMAEMRNSMANAIQPLRF